MPVKSDHLDPIEKARIVAARAAAREKFKHFARDNGRPSGAMDPENPPLTDAQLSAMRPAHEIHPELVRRKGRTAAIGRPKQAISIRLDADLVAALRVTGDGWQTRVNDMLREMLKPTA